MNYFSGTVFEIGAATPKNKFEPNAKKIKYRLIKTFK
jgi:hypothetical protein